MSRLFATDGPAASAASTCERAGEKTNGKPVDPAGAKPAEPCNGKSAEPAAQAKPEAAADKQASAPGSRVEKAEELTDKIAVGVAMFAANVGRKIVRVVSHVGEAASDIWAEAQCVRKGKK